MIFITNKEKIPENPWSRYLITDERWRLIYIVGQVVFIVGCVLSITSNILSMTGTFLWNDNQYIEGIGAFFFTLGLLLLIAGSKSENEDEYDKILRIGMTVILSLGVIALPVIYIIKLVW